MHHALVVSTRRLLSVAAAPCVVGLLTAAACSETDEASRGVDATTLVPPATDEAAPEEATSAPNPRGAAANVRYVTSLVDGGDLPASTSVVGVRADGDEIVVTTSLTDRVVAVELWEALANVLGCDDSFLFVRGWRVVLDDGSVVDGPGPNFEYCVGT